MGAYGSPWEDLNIYSCGWWIEYNQEAITDAIHKAINTSQTELSAMGERGRKLMEKNYSIEAIGCKMKTLYEWILGKGAKPKSVYEL